MALSAPLQRFTPAVSKGYLSTIENPFFLAKDVSAWIEIKNVSDMISRIDPSEVTKLNLGSQRGESWFLTEDGLYEVLFQSRKPIAREFKSQVKYISEPPLLASRVTESSRCDFPPWQTFVGARLPSIIGYPSHLSTGFSHTTATTVPRITV